MTLTLTDLDKQIEMKKLELVNIVKELGYSLTDQLVVQKSQELDQLLNQYDQIRTKTK